MKDRVTIGLEIHVQLQTRAKLFCGCPTDYGAPPNSRVCPVCLGLPGALPQLNREAVTLAVRAALALGCKVNSYSEFDRKHYYYPDLPKGYQITQQRLPVAAGGELPTSLGTVTLIRLHLEEDVGKLVHTSTATLIDYNRSGLPLAEIVTAPCLVSAAQARAFLEALRQTLLYAGISDCKLEEGSLRCDANISLDGGKRAEIKNLNSFKAVEQALAYEIQRQGSASDRADLPSQTLRWDEKNSCTVPMRVKESAAAYCYLPEPDLPPLAIDGEMLAQAQADLPEPPWDRWQRFSREYKLTPQDSQRLTLSRQMADLFEDIVVAGGQPQPTANLLLGEVSHLLNVGQGKLPTPGQLAQLLAAQEQGQVSATAAKEILTQMFVSGHSAATIIKELALGQLSDQDYLERLATRIIAANPGVKQDYLGGKGRALGRLMGLAMQASKGQAHPAKLKETLIHILNEQKH